MKTLPSFKKISAFILAATLVVSLSANAATKYKPFVSAASETGTIDEATARVSDKLTKAGFEVLGNYSPYEDNSARIIGFTHQDLKTAAITHNRGGFGAVLRVAVTANNGTLEVSYTNPPYSGYAYHIGPLKSMEKLLKTTLGGGAKFGAKGLNKRDLGDYHYQMFMPYFEDAITIATFSSHEKALAAANKSVAHADSDLTKLWQIRIGADQVIIGVQLNKGWWKGQIQNIMSKVDLGSPKATAALPWEVLISGNDIVYLPGRFRIALMFPDLTMSNFMNIMEVPGQMEATANKLAELSK